MTRKWVLRAACAALAIGSAVQAGAETRLRPSLIAESIEPAAGASTRIAIRMKAMPGWHGYWLNPGDVGMPLKVEWTAPAGVRFGELEYPAPSLLKTSGLLSYVLPGDHYLSTNMVLPAGLARGTVIPLVAKLSWLACSDSACTAERGEASLTLEVGDGGKSAITVDVFVEIDKEKPRALAGVSAIETGRGLRIEVPTGHRLNLSQTHIFFSDQAIPTGARQTVTHHHGRDVIDVAFDEKLRSDRVRGVISDGQQAWSFSARAREEAAISSVAKSEPLEDEKSKMAQIKPVQTMKNVAHIVQNRKYLDQPNPANVPQRVVILAAMMGGFLLMIIAGLAYRFR